MSFLSEEIERQMQSQKLTGLAVASKLNVSPSQFYNWQNGHQTHISPEDLTSLAHALSVNFADHAALVRAHLLDEKFGPGSELVRIEIDTPAELRDRPRPKSKRERAMQYLIEQSLESRDCAQMFIELARVLGCEDV